MHDDAKGSILKAQKILAKKIGKSTYINNKFKLKALKYFIKNLLIMIKKIEI